MQHAPFVQRRWAFDSVFVQHSKRSLHAVPAAWHDEHCPTSHWPLQHSLAELHDVPSLLQVGPVSRPPLFASTGRTAPSVTTLPPSVATLPPLLEPPTFPPLPALPLA